MIQQHVWHESWSHNAHTIKCLWIIYIYIIQIQLTNILPPNHSKWPCDPLFQVYKVSTPGLMSLGWTCWNETCPSTGSTPRTENFAPATVQRLRLHKETQVPTGLMWSSRCQKQLLNLQGLHLPQHRNATRNLAKTVMSTEKMCTYKAISTDHPSSFDCLSDRMTRRKMCHVKDTKRIGCNASDAFKPPVLQLSQNLLLHFIGIRNINACRDT